MSTLRARLLVPDAPYPRTVLPKRLRERVDAMPTVLAWMAYAASFGTVIGLLASIASSVLGHTPHGLSTGFGRSVEALWLTAASLGIITSLLFWRDRRAWALLAATVIGGALWQVTTTTRLDLGVVAGFVILLLPETRRYFAVGRRVTS